MSVTWTLRTAGVCAASVAALCLPLLGAVFAPQGAHVPERIGEFLTTIQQVVALVGWVAAAIMARRVLRAREDPA